MKAHISSIACIPSAMWEAHLKRFLNKNKWKLVKNPKRADLIVVNTCAMNKAYENHSINEITRLSSIKKENAEMIVVGCLPSINKKSLDSVFNGLTFTHANINDITSVIVQDQKIEQIRCAHEYDYEGYTDNKFKTIKLLLSQFSPMRFLYFPMALIHSLSNRFNNSFCIQVSTGCLGNCSYCAAKTAKGALKSNSKQVIMREFKRGLRKGFKKFVLVGDDVGAYGQDLRGESIITLLKSMVEVPGNFMITVSALNPEWLIAFQKGFMEVFETGKISSIIVPIQSGSDRVLKRMRRKYKSREVKEYLISIKKKFPKIKMFTHIIVGFPEETEEDFKKTWGLVNSVGFDSLLIIPFQVGTCTDAEKMQQLSQSIIKNRVKKSWRNSFVLLLKNYARKLHS